jgi:hypothetical protein
MAAGEVPHPRCLTYCDSSTTNSSKQGFLCLGKMSTTKNIFLRTLVVQN